MDQPERTLEENIGPIRTIVKRICMRSAMQEPDIEDVVSYTFERLVDNDYRIFREFRGVLISQSYLVLVITNICRDYFRQQTGRWRSSAKALDLGEPAIRLEELIYRHRYSFEEAVEIVHTEYENENRRPPTRSKMEELVVQLKIKHRNITFNPGDPLLSNLAASTPDFDASIRIKELAPIKNKLDTVIETLKTEMDDEEELVFRLYFKDNHNISSISKTTGQSRYQIRKMLDDTLARFKNAILKEGFAQSDIDEILEYFC